MNQERKRREEFEKNWRPPCCDNRQPEAIPNQSIHRCLSCGKAEPREIYTMHCVFCEKLILSDTADWDEIDRLQKIGELQLRTLECSFDVEWYEKDKETGEMVKVKQRHRQKYPVCGACIRKEKAEDEEVSDNDDTGDSSSRPLPKSTITLNPHFDA
jgi:hypothetical protein